MGEIVHIQVGQYGNQIGHKFWEIITNEHGLGPTGSYVGNSDSQLTRINTYFDESPMESRSYIPRAVLVDMDSDSIDWVRSGTAIGRIFRPDNFIAGEFSAASCFAKGFYEEGHIMARRTMEVVRREVERCDRLQGFQLVHGLGGGCGSGLGARILAELSDEFRDKERVSFSFFPSPFAYSCVVEPYNAVLGLHYLIEDTTATFCMDNGVLTRRIHETLSCESFVRMAASTISEITACNRFKSQIGCNFVKMETNMIPYPRMHFFITGIAQPIHSPDLYPYRPLTLPSLVNQMFDAKNLMLTCDPRRGLYFTMMTMFRGDLYANEVEEYMARLHSESSAHFIEWLPNNMKTTLCDFSSPDQAMSAAYIGNTSAINQRFQCIHDDFDSIWKKKAFLNSYHATQMEEMEFSEAQHNMRDLMDEYQLREADSSEL